MSKKHSNQTDIDVMDDDVTPVVTPTAPILLQPEAAALRCRMLVSEIQQNIAKSIFALKEIHDHKLYEYMGYGDFREFVAIELKNIIPLTQAITYLTIGKRFDSESALKVFRGNIKQILQFANDPDYSDVTIGESYAMRNGEKIGLDILEAEISASYIEKERALNEKIKTAKQAKKGSDVLLERKEQLILELKEEAMELRSQLDAVVHTDKKNLVEALGTERQVKGHFDLATQRILSELQELESVDIAKFAKNANIRTHIAEKIQSIETGLSSLREAFGGILYSDKKGKVK
ncbi:MULTISPECIES: hypothetical protein [Leptospira]|uniref:hypothetical protein n=1 Tax=Leptospira TaxID=171 RepID=UPI0007737E07|nr:MULTISPECIES: hypothetical protein [Leptospira]UML79148.1 hypothetical protein FH602_12435 [Leptospira kirschneri]UML80360.1 hypothetical protein FH602_19280 [Leptospira kirschneri]UMQ54055.1 hypothetical protein FH582_19430 [Leptospira interrogans]